MAGLTSAGCSRAVRRPNAALVVESKRSGSSSSGESWHLVCRPRQELVWRCFWVAGGAAIGHQRGIHCGFG